MLKLPCPPADYPRFSALLDEAMDLTEEELQQFLDSLDGDDAHFRVLLAKALGGSVERGTGELLQSAWRHLDEFTPGSVIGPYRLEARIGEGGMGEVWRASRRGDGPRRDVALKLPHPQFLGTAFLRRFARERDVLAALSHPAIAQLYDAGTGEAGHPYLTLELVEGSPITNYCRSISATLAQRIDLIEQVLDALAYAHQRLIVHRDIKPGNVLVTPDGRVKLLDFGIAKLLSGDAAGDEALTQMGRLATPAYAAPEQLSGGVITVATDIFSTGVLLYELCTGQRPFVRVPDSARAEAAPLASQRVDAPAAGMPAKPDPKRHLRGDLDAIIARALCLDADGRYATAEAFADDLHHWRYGLPVRARRIGWLTRTQKFVRRNPLGVALGVVLALSLAGGTGGIAWQAQRAEAQAKRAEAQASRATAIKDFMISLFEAGDPHAGAKNAAELTAHDLLNRGADRAESAFANDPATKIELLATLGRIFDGLDDSRVQEMSARRLQLTRQLYGDDDPAVISDTIDLAGDEAKQGNFSEAQAQLEHVRLPIMRRYGTDSREWARWLSWRVNAIRSQHGSRSEMTADLETAVGIYARHPPDAADTDAIEAYGGALFLLAALQREAEDYAAALDNLRAMRTLIDRLAPQDVLGRLTCLAGIATTLSQQGQLDAADAMFADVARQAEPVAGRQSQMFQYATFHRASLASLRGERDKAQGLFDTLGDSARSGKFAAGQAYAAFLVATGRGAEALPLLRAALARVRARSWHENDERIVEASLGEALAQAGQPAEARAMLDAARDDYLRWGVPGTAETLSVRESWARFLLDHGEGDKAEPELRAIAEYAGKTASAPVALAISDLARIALARGDLAAAQSLSAQAAALLDRVRMAYDVRNRIPIWMTRAQVLLTADDSGLAQSLALKASAAADTYDAPEAQQRLLAHRLAAVLEQTR